MMASPEPICRLYLEVRPQPSNGITAVFEQIAAHTDVACVLFHSSERGHDLTLAAEMLRRTHQRNLAFLIENNAELALGLGADGIQIAADANAYTGARACLGDAAIIGADCGESRHAAMTLAEMGADYVAFGRSAGAAAIPREQRAELISWWSEIFQIPCVALDVGDADEARLLAKLGADFVVPSPELWLVDNAAGEILEIASAISQARSAA